MKTINFSNLIWKQVILPIPSSIIFRVESSSDNHTEIEIDGENFIKLMKHFDECGLNRITKDEISALASLYDNLYNNS